MTHVPSLRSLMMSRLLAAVAAAALLWGCGDDSGGDPTTDAVQDADDTHAVGDVDAASDTVATDSSLPDTAETDEDTQTADGEDTVTPPTPTFALNWPMFDAPSDPLAGSAVESCDIYQAETCQGGTRRTCDIYDVDASAFDAAPPDMLRRAYLYDRWYDLYASPDGQTAERRFTQPMEPGTPEAVWSDPANFAGWSGAGDSAIWTGTALNAYILRYLHTGTEADYQRMEEKTRVMLRFFEVTGIPGYLARYHYLQVPEGTPPSTEHMFESGEHSPDHRDIENPGALSFLPEVYTSGLGTPRWSGDPSIDQMNGPMVAFPMVYGLLRDEALKSQIAYQMTCYLHSLRRIELINLQDNQEALDSFEQYFAGVGLNIDPNDTFDPRTLDTMVLYVHPQINTNNEDTYDRSCGDFIQMEPWRVIDASKPSLLLDVITLASDMMREENRPQQINHFYIPSLRGADAVHMMHLTAMAWAFTGDDRYREFLERELLGNIRTADVASIMSALIPPRYCRKFFGTNIIAGPMWAFNNLLTDSELDVRMQEAMRDDLWGKEGYNIGNANLELMFAGAVSPEIGGAARQTALDEALAILAEFGGNGGVLDDPRRIYARTYDEVLAAMPAGNGPRCATAQERAFCEQSISAFGVEVPGTPISFACTGASSECVMDDGLCTRAAADAPLPPHLRRWGDYQWQRSPFDMGDDRPHGLTQSPGTDYAEQYWMARFYDFIPGAQEVLAWRDTGEACP